MSEKFVQNEIVFFTNELEEFYEEDADIRLTLLTSCQSGCGFCHLEAHKGPEEIGTLNPALIDWKTKDNAYGLRRFDNAMDLRGVQSVVDFCLVNGVRSVHLTGGEPTLHPNIAEIINKFVSHDMNTGMTTHGEYGSSRIQKLVGAGLTSLNFSMHASNPEEYVSMDLIAQSIAKEKGYEAALRYARNRLSLKTANIILAMQLANSGEYPRFKGPKLNAVIQNVESAKNILGWSHVNNIPCRLQRDLNRKAESDYILASLLEEIGATPISRKESFADSSGGSTEYITSAGWKFKIKHFSPVLVDEMCGDCDAKYTPACRENFYGLRLEASNDELRVRACIDKNIDELTTWSLDDFRSQMDRQDSVPHALMMQYR